MCQLCLSARLSLHCMKTCALGLLEMSFIGKRVILNALGHSLEISVRNYIDYSEIVCKGNFCVLLNFFYKVYHLFKLIVVCKVDV